MLIKKRLLISRHWKVMSPNSDLSVRQARATCETFWRLSARKTQGLIKKRPVDRFPVRRVCLCLSLLKTRCMHDSRGRTKAKVWPEIVEPFAVSERGVCVPSALRPRRRPSRPIPCSCCRRRIPEKLIDDLRNSTSHVEKSLRYRGIVKHNGV